MAQTDLTIAGVGGQGSILAGVILGSAAVTFDHRYATQTQAYSSELRGGFAATWVIVSDQPIEYPRVIQSDILVAQAQDSIDRFGAALKSSGILIVDSDMVEAIAAVTRAHRLAPPPTAIPLATTATLTPRPAQLLRHGLMFAMLGFVLLISLIILIFIIERGKR